MIDIPKLKGRMAEKDISQAKMAKEIGVTSRTFYRKMKIGIFNNIEIKIMLEKLDLKDANSIFFADEVS